MGCSKVTLKSGAAKNCQPLARGTHEVVKSTNTSHPNMLILSICKQLGSWVSFVSLTLRVSGFEPLWHTCRVVCILPTSTWNNTQLYMYRTRDFERRQRVPSHLSKSCDDVSLSLRYSCVHVVSLSPDEKHYFSWIISNDERQITFCSLTIQGENIWRHSEVICSD